MAKITAIRHFIKCRDKQLQINRSKQRWQGLGWKIHERAQCFVSRSYSMHELRDRDVSIGKILNIEQTAVVFCALSGQKSELKHTTKNFVGFHNHSLLSNMVKLKSITLVNRKGHRQYSDPIKARSNYMQLTQRAGKRVRQRHDWCWFNF